MNTRETGSLEIRSKFPSLSKSKAVFLDGPAGTQVPQEVIDRISSYYVDCNANTHGAFQHSIDAGKTLDECRFHMAQFLNAPDPKCISVGANMTSLNFQLSHAIRKAFKAGDEIIISALDHESNRAPWLAMQDFGIKVKEIELLDNGKLNYNDLEAKINTNTKLIAVGMAANIFGTVNDIEKVNQLRKNRDILLLLDAVHYAPHLTIDVNALDCDFLLCSAYKFYGPHVGILYCKPDLLDSLDTYRLRTQTQYAPFRIEIGTPNFAALAGVTASIKYIASFGDGETLREKCVSAMDFISKREKMLFNKLYEGLSQIDDIQIIGPDNRETLRAPTIAFLHLKMTAKEVCAKLAKENINAWSGHFYAIRATEVLGLLEQGGVTRMGISIYISEEEIDRTLKVMKTL